MTLTLAKIESAGGALTTTPQSFTNQPSALASGTHSVFSEARTTSSGSVLKQEVRTTAYFN